MRKRFYILFVARDGEGQLRKIPIPLHYMYVFLAGALIGMFTITGMAGSYARMLLKTVRFNQLRSEKQMLESRYTKLEQVAKQREIRVASLGSLANDVSMLYGLKPEAAVASELGDEEVTRSIDRLYALRRSALNGAATLGIAAGRLNVTTADWHRLAMAPNLWPVEGRVSGSYGERIDPFNGEGALHRGIDISASYGAPVVAPAEGVVQFAAFVSGYGRLVVVQHGSGISTRFGHLSGFAVTAGQQVQRGDIIGYVGQSGRSTGPHLHYEVWVRNAPVNPHSFLRTTLARAYRLSGD